jgi:hypothetical protein
MGEGSKETNQAPAEKSTEDDPELILKGVEAFALSVALFGASVAVSHTVIAQLDGEMPTLARVIIASVLMLINIAVSTFGYLALVLARSMTGIFQPKGRIKPFEWGIAISWLFFSFAVAQSIKSA